MHQFWMRAEKIFLRIEEIYLQMKSGKDYANMVFYISCIMPRKAKRKKKENIALMG